MRFKTIIAVLCFFLIITAGCSQLQEKQKEAANSKVEYPKVEEDHMSFIDGRGEKVTLKKNPKRVVILYNSYLDLWVSAGGSNRVVGRVETRGEVPASVAGAEIVGSLNSPNIEKILSLKPDLVVLRPTMTGQRAIIPVLEENDIDFAALEYDNFDDYLKLLRLFTFLTGRDDLYLKKGVEVKGKIDEIIAKVPEGKKPTVLILFGTSTGVSVRLPNSMVGDMVKDLGGVNIAYDARLTEEEMEVFSMEKVIERDPDFILVQTMGSVEKVKDRIKKEVENNPAWSTLTAVKEGRYIFLPKDLYLYKPNERYAEAYEGLARILYPDIFQ